MREERATLQTVCSLHLINPPYPEQQKTQMKISVTFNFPLSARVSRNQWFTQTSKTLQKPSVFLLRQRWPP